MGGPSNEKEIDIFLKNMFNDYNILRIKNSVIRKLVSKIIINKIRYNVKSHYDLIGGKSPINAITERLVKKLTECDSEKYYTYAMNYTPPFSIDVLKKLKENDIEEITLFSMYPQYSTTTIKSSTQSIYSAMKMLNYYPKIKIVKHYHRNEIFNKAILEKIKETLINEKAEEYILILSAHSIPKKIIDKGDTYQKECEENKEILETILKKENMFFKNIVLSYQSKLGRGNWLTPTTIETIELYKNEKIIIYPIAFTIDNSETEYELKIEYKEIAEKKHNIKNFLVCSCLNDSDLFIKTILKLIKSI